MTPAQRALFDEHLPYARKLARKFARSAPTWQDEYMSAALRALAESAEAWVEGTKGLRGKPATFKTFMYIRLKQRLGDVTRYTRRRKRTPAGRQVALDIQLDRAAARRPDPLAPARFAEVLALIEDDRQREAVRLHYCESCTMAEIGRRFGCSRQRVGQIIAGAIALLRTRLIDSPPE